jgi:hypothetical protein
MNNQEIFDKTINLSDLKTIMADNPMIFTILSEALGSLEIASKLVAERGEGPFETVDNLSMITKAELMAIQMSAMIQLPDSSEEEIKQVAQQAALFLEQCCAIKFALACGFLEGDISFNGDYYQEMIKNIEEVQARVMGLP